MQPVARRISEQMYDGTDARADKLTAQIVCRASGQREVHPEEAPADAGVGAG